MYRIQFAYDLAPLNQLSTANSPIATRISSATLRLTIQGGLTRTATPSGKLACFANTGGVSGINVLRPGTPIRLAVQKHAFRRPMIIEIAAGFACLTAGSS
jgi:hypothetical protein